MDTFTFMMVVLLLMIAVQFEEMWLAFAIVAIMIIATRSVSTALLLIFTSIVLFALKESIEVFWPFIFFGLIILALMFGLGKSEAAAQPEYYSPEMYSGLMGGMEGGM